MEIFCILAISYRDLYATYRHVLSSDSRKSRDAVRWSVSRLSTPLLSHHLQFAVQKPAKRKGKVRTPSYTPMRESFWYKSLHLQPPTILYAKAVKYWAKGDIAAMDQAYIDYEKLEALTQREVLYVWQNEEESKITLWRTGKIRAIDGPGSAHTTCQGYLLKFWRWEILIHHACIGYFCHADISKAQLVALLTNDMESWTRNEIIEIYRKRWEWTVVQADKQNFPLKYFYGEVNAIKIQI